MNDLELHEAVEAMRRGEVVLIQTDTLPGLHVVASDEGAQKLIDLKGAPPERPFLLLVGDVEDALELGHCADPMDEVELASAWPGPLTALLVPEPETPEEWTDHGETVAVRVPAPLMLREFLTEVGVPVFSTSANRSGEDPATDLEEASKIFPDLPRLKWDAPESSEASTIVDFSEHPAFVIREGSAPWPPRMGPNGSS